jgi:hypothetical protein
MYWRAQLSSFEDVSLGSIFSRGILDEILAMLRFRGANAQDLRAGKGRGKGISAGIGRIQTICGRLEIPIMT